MNKPPESLWLGNRRNVVVTLRLIVFSIIYLIILQERGLADMPPVFWVATGAFLLSEIICLFEYKTYFLVQRILGWIFVFDAVLISLLIYLLGVKSSQLFIGYFAVIAIAAISKKVLASFVITFLVSAFYLFASIHAGSFGWLEFLTRTLFFFGVAIFASYLSQEVDDQQHKKNKVEKALNESKMQYVSLLTNPLVGIYQSTLKGDFIYVNQTLAGMLDYDSARELMQIKAFGMYKNAANRMVFVEQLKKSGSISSFEVELKTKSGQTRHVLISGTLDGETISGVIMDITERKQAEEKIKHLNLVLKAIRNVNQLITHERDRDKLIKEACAKLIETRGYYSAWIAVLDKSGKLLTAAEAGFDSHFLPMMKQMEKDHLPACAQTALKQEDILLIDDAPSFCRNCSLLKKDPNKKNLAVRLEYHGHIFGVLVVAYPPEIIMDEEELGLFREVTSDIAFALHSMKLSEQHEQAEDDLRESEEKFRAVFDTANDGILVASIDDKKFYLINKTICKMLGYSQDELKSMGVTDIHPKEDLPYVMGQFEKQLRGEIDIAINLPIKRKDGTVFYADVNASLLKSGGKEYLVGLFRDITERNKLESQLFQAQKLESVGTLAGGIAHDFNNMLGAIKGCAELSLMDIDKTSPIHEYLKHIVTAADQAGNLTRQLLIFSRTHSAEFKPLNLNDIVNNMHKMLIRMISEDIKIENKLAPDIVTIKADAGNVEQVLMNLVVNARDAMPQGGTISIKTENLAVDEKYCQLNIESRCGNFVCLTVSDTGTGMDKEVVSHIFEPFYTTKPQGKGTGLGLAVVYGIVKQHQGWTNVYSEPGQGSVLKIYLPASTEMVPSKSDTKIISPEQLKGKGERVLVVEDNDRLRETVSMALKKMNYTVFAASNGAQARQLFAQEKGDFRLILSDVVLPDTNGVDLCDELIKAQPGIRALLSSGYASKGAFSDTIHERQLPFIQKPYNLAVLFKTIQEILGKQQ